MTKPDGSRPTDGSFDNDKMFKAVTGYIQERQRRNQLIWKHSSVSSVDTPETQTEGQGMLDITSMTNAELARTLRETSEEEWNELRRASRRHVGNVRIAIRNEALDKCDLSNRDLSDITFYHVSLNETNLRGAHLAHTAFQYCEMEAAVLDDSTATDASFVMTGMRIASFRGATLNQAEFLRTNLTCSDFTGALLMNSAFEHTICTATCFSKANVKNVTYRFGDLSGARFQGAYTGDAVLTGRYAWVGEFSGKPLLLFEAENDAGFVKL